MCDISFISQLLPRPIPIVAALKHKRRITVCCSTFIAGFWISRHWDLGPSNHLGQPVRLHQSRGASHHQPYPAGDPGQHQQEKEQEEEEEEKEKSARTICWTTGEVEEGPERGDSSAEHWAPSRLAVWRPKYVTTTIIISSCSLPSRLVHSHWSRNVEARLSLVESDAGASSLMP